MVQSTRCRFMVFDNETKRHRLCKKKYCVNNQYCIIHAKFLYNEKAIYIQKIFRGHYIRKKININFKDISIKSINDYDEIILIGSGKGVTSVSKINDLKWKRRKTGCYTKLNKIYNSLV